MENTLHRTNKIKSLVKASLDNTISSADRLELEKIALDDDFLFDALEGYADNKVNKMPLLEYNISSQKSGASVINLRTIISIAASFILIAAAIGFFYFKNSDTTSVQAVANTDPEVKEKVFASEELTSTTEKSNEVAESDEESTPTSVTPNLKTNTSGNTIADSEKKINSKPAQEVAVVPTAKATKPDYSQEAPKLNKSIVLGDNSKETMSVSSSSDQPYPEIGFEKLRDNIRNSKIRQRAFMLRCSGDIEIHFTISRDGSPDGFKIKDSHCPPCEELLEEIIRNSGKWVVPPKAPNREAAYIYRIQ